MDNFLFLLPISHSNKEFKHSTVAYLWRAGNSGAFKALHRAIRKKKKDWQIFGETWDKPVKGYASLH